MTTDMIYLIKNIDGKEHYEAITRPSGVGSLLAKCIDVQMQFSCQTQNNLYK